MEKDISVAISEKMEKTMAVLRKELGSLKAGRANPHVLDRITVDYFGTPTPINQMANISTPEPRLLQITLWDASQLQAVEKAIMGSDRDPPV